MNTDAEEPSHPYKTVEEVINLLSLAEFDIPRNQEDSTDDFPAYLKKQLDQYTTYYSEQVKPVVDDVLTFVHKDGQDATSGSPILEKITQLADGINKTVDFYYRGRLLQAMEELRKTLNQVRYPASASVIGMGPGYSFYRTRLVGERRYTRHDLFHNPFQNRGRVATNRFSIPGLPALYLGDSTYVCWEESDQKPIGSLYFSRFVNEEQVKMIRIQRLPDFAAEMKAATFLDEGQKMTLLMRYLAMFPLSIACSIRTKSRNDTFKPEYIIPQLLLQYVMEEKQIDGIMFPSTRVKYNNIQRVPAYNYVFPVGQVAPQGYCSDLVRTFALTEPTSTELESMMTYSNLPNQRFGFDLVAAQRQTITLIEGQTFPYFSTVFGSLEQTLLGRSTAHLTI